MFDTTANHIEELMSRESNGISVSLFWNREDDSLTVCVFDAASESAFELEVGASSPLDVFHHPFAYAAHRGLLPSPWPASPRTRRRPLHRVAHRPSPRPPAAGPQPAAHSRVLETRQMSSSVTLASVRRVNEHGIAATTLVATAGTARRGKEDRDDQLHDHRVVRLADRHARGVG